MDRRDFVKIVGAGGLLAGVGALLGVGCTETQNGDVPEVEPDPVPAEMERPAENGEPEPGDEATDDPGSEQDAPGEDEAEASGSSEGVEAVVDCPNCGAENDVSEWGVEITCWKCGHVWAPQKAA
jgi:hypothetical protein